MVAYSFIVSELLPERCSKGWFCVQNGFPVSEFHLFCSLLKICFFSLLLPFLFEMPVAILSAC